MPIGWMAFSIVSIARSSGKSIRATAEIGPGGWVFVDPTTKAIPPQNLESLAHGKISAAITFFGPGELEAHHKVPVPKQADAAAAGSVNNVKRKGAVPFPNPGGGRGGEGAHEDGGEAHASVVGLARFGVKRSSGRKTITPTRVGGEANGGHQTQGPFGGRIVSKGQAGRGRGGPSMTEETNKKIGKRVSGAWGR